MMAWALIQNGRVQEVFTERPVLHDGLVLAEAPDDVRQGQVAQDGRFVDLPEPSVPEADLARMALFETDRRMARVAEDMIDALIAKNVIAPSDLPRPVRDLLDRRRAARRALGG
ncbi:MAG: hypothetical protein FJX47_21820 [Alphaproteobacteria bacterium]|nr:hypothetical protein [Alphaproteobacteria bacterium]